jgi:hypothetical protein
MLFSPDRNKLRQTYVVAWSRFRQGLSLEPLQAQIAAVVQIHPEYHAILDNGDAALGQDFPPELGQSNPFLHMGLHLAVRDQVATDRPAGIRSVYSQLAATSDSEHDAEHLLLECLAESLWQAHRQDSQADEQAYLESIRRKIPRRHET